VDAFDDENTMNIQFERKLERPKSDYAAISVFMFTHQVFDVIQNIRPSERGELEITSVNNLYMKKNKMTSDIIEREWTDAGTFESLMQANEILFPINNTIQKGDE